MDIVDQIIRIICEYHKIFAGIWEQIRKEKVNYKKKQITDLINNDNLLAGIFQYRSLLNINILKLTELFCALENLHACNCRINTRVKTYNSIVQKIKIYLVGDLRGKVAIKKCLNDLYGIRIILSNDMEFDTIIDHINETFPELKCLNASKNGYKAVHVYFSESNFELPWELQIWNASDESKNIELHKTYKQGYTEWENDYNEGGGTV